MTLTTMAHSSWNHCDKMTYVRTPALSTCSFHGLHPSLCGHKQLWFVSHTMSLNCHLLATFTSLPHSYWCTQDPTNEISGQEPWLPTEFRSLPVLPTTIKNPMGLFLSTNQEAKSMEVVGSAYWDLPQIETSMSKGLCCTTFTIIQSTKLLSMAVVSQKEVRSRNVRDYADAKTSHK